MRKIQYLLLFVLACTSEGKQKEEENTPSQNLRTTELTQVKVSEAVRKPFAYIIQSTGKVEATQISQVHFKISGHLEQIFVNNGQIVSKGQLLAKLNTQLSEIALAKAQNLVSLKKNEFEDNLIKYRYQTEKIPEEIRQKIRISTGLTEAEINLKDAELQVTYGSLYAPFAGRIADLDSKAHNPIGAEKPFCTLYGVSSLVVRTEVLESEVGKLRIGQKATLIPLVDKTKGYEAILSEINPKVNTNGTVHIKLTINHPQELLPGMNFLVRLTVPEAETVVVPKNAIVIRSGKQVVFTVENGLAKWNYVKTGVENDTEVAIVEGLQAGKQVIITNNLQLAHDSPVKVVK